MYHPSDPEVNWMSPVQGKSPLVQVKVPYDNFDMVTVGFHPATRMVQCNLQIMLEASARQYIEKDSKERKESEALL